MSRDIRCLVKKGDGDFDRAAGLGYAINLHCADGYMWLSYPGHMFNSAERLKKIFEMHLEKDGFEKISAVEFR
ncbi:hypothetical protein P7_087 [Pectobacterium phage vB_PcaM_P7_Pc]|nr:hypothetical protein P7_087 [Pectobacterium phage vB_PcaM_P7_Pc]